VLRSLPPVDDERLLVDATTGDDAAVWKLDADRALIVTADFITPLVDDAFVWGQIAAANAVSDVYAMGGRPLLALNLVGWNRDELPTDLLGRVLQGASDIAATGGFVIAGGHTVDDPEPKFGLAVVGESHPDRLLTNAGIRPGQDVILTKPLGIGIISTAIKRGVEAARAGGTVWNAAVASMIRLNDEASRIALAAGATGATDITGFGLLGHLGRAALESTVDVTIEVDSVPVLPGVRELLADNYLPGGSRRNLESMTDRLDIGGRDPSDALVLADAQTSGGLVFAVDPAATVEVLDSLRTTGHEAAHIGSTSPVPGTGTITLR
jgi:selenide,water dikinase